MPAEKKRPYRFQLAFNENDPIEQKVAQLLSQQGQRKTKFVVDAIVIASQHQPNVTEWFTIQQRFMMDPLPNESCEIFETYLPSNARQQIAQPKSKTHPSQDAASIQEAPNATSSSQTRISTVVKSEDPSPSDSLPKTEAARSHPKKDNDTPKEDTGFTLNYEETPTEESDSDLDLDDFIMASEMLFGH